jgi:hypothetical protein
MEHVSGLQISRFFLNSPSTTQQQCDQEAERITGGPVHPTTMQGAATYTVLSNARNGGLVVQFRHGGSVLDLDLLGHAKQTYGSLVPRLESAYRLGELNVYTMDNVGGVAMYLARKQLQQHDCYLLHQTVQDFAMSVDTNIPPPSLTSRKPCS